MARYTPDELEKWYFVPSIASKAAPTVAEIGAGTEFSATIVTVNGFKFSGTKVDTPDLGNRFTTNVPGRLTADDSSIQFYKGDASGDAEEIIRALLVRDAVGYIVRNHPKNGAIQTIAAAAKVEVWPVKVMATSVDPPQPGNAAMFTVDFAIPAQPVLPATVAA